MSRQVSLPDNVYDRVAKLAAKQGMSLDEVVLVSLSQVLATHDFFESRAARANRPDLRAVLKRVPDYEPEERERL